MSLELGPQRILIAEPRGLCAGVDRSIQAYDEAIKQNPDEAIYSVGQPAHNTHINRRFEEKGIRFVESVSEVPIGAVALLGPHGTEVEQLKIAKERGLTVYDTTCPLVTKVEDEIKLYTQKGIVTVYWGDENHQEAKSATSVGDVILVSSAEEALSDEVFNKIGGREVAFASQTTFNADEATILEEKLKERYPNLITPRIPDRCYATRNRQSAVKEMVDVGVEFVVIVGSKDSSNSRRLYETAIIKGADAVFVDSAEELDSDILLGRDVVGFGSGASVEEDVFQEVVRKATERFEVSSEVVKVADETRIRFAPVKRVDHSTKLSLG